MSAQRFGRLEAVEDERAVRLVGDHQHRFADDAIEFAQNLLAVDRAGGVVGRIQNDGLGARRDGGGDAPDIGLEAVVGLHQDHAALVILDVVLVLGEVGIQDDDFVAGIEDRLEHDIDGPGRARPS